MLASFGSLSGPRLSPPSYIYRGGGVRPLHCCKVAKAAALVKD